MSASNYLTNFLCVLNLLHSYIILFENQNRIYMIYKIEKLKKNLKCIIFLFTENNSDFSDLFERNLLNSVILKML